MQSCFVHISHHCVARLRHNTEYYDVTSVRRCSHQPRQGGCRVLETVLVSLGSPHSSTDPVYKEHMYDGPPIYDGSTEYLASASDLRRRRLHAERGKTRADGLPSPIKKSKDGRLVSQSACGALPAEEKCEQNQPRTKPQTRKTPVDGMYSCPVDGPLSPPGRA